MTLNNRKLPMQASLLALLTALVMAVAPLTATAGDLKDPSETLSYVESLTREVRQDAATLKSYTRFPMLYSHEAHERVLARIRSNVNAIGDEVQKLHTHRAGLQKWQAELTTRILPKLQNLVADTESAIEFMDTTPNSNFRPVYQSYVEDMYDASNSIVRNLDNFLDWADAVAEHKAATE